MSDISLTINELNIIFQTLTMQMLGLDITIPGNAYFVRVSWPTTGAPAWNITEDIAFLRIVESDDKYNRQREDKFVGLDSDNGTNIMRFTRVMQVFWTFYGPNSFENAQVIRDRMFYQDNHDILANSNLYLIPDIVSPIRAPELFQGQWWERTDLNMRFNELISKDLTIPYIKSAEIIIEDDSGILVDMTVE